VVTASAQPLSVGATRGAASRIGPYDATVHLVMTVL
jgi:hypothetical protein